MASGWHAGRHTLGRKEGEFLQKMLPSLFPPNGVISLMTVSFADFLQSPTQLACSVGHEKTRMPRREVERGSLLLLLSRPLSILFLTVCAETKVGNNESVDSDFF